MAHEHTKECEELHEALESLQAQQTLPRDAMDPLAAQVVNPQRAVGPVGDTPEVETEIVRIRTALAALECDR